MKAPRRSAALAGAAASESALLKATSGSKGSIPTADLQRLDAETACVLARLRRERAARHLHRLGPRPVLEAMAEVEAGEPLDAVLTRYGRLDSQVVHALGADDFPPPPISMVPK